jgi:hypothetical protein
MPHPPRVNGRSRIDHLGSPAMRSGVLSIAVAAAALAGCGGSSSTSSSQTIPSESKPKATTTPPAQPTRTATGSGGVTAPSSGSGQAQPNPSGPASVSVAPLTVSPGRTFTVTLKAPAGTRIASVTLSGTGGSASAAMSPRAGGFVATLVVPRGLQGGFWPVVARYGTTSLSASVSTQVKVFTP